MDELTVKKLKTIIDYFRNTYLRTNGKKKEELIIMAKKFNIIDKNDKLNAEFILSTIDFDNKNKNKKKIKSEKVILDKSNDQEIKIINEPKKEKIEIKNKKIIPNNNKNSIKNTVILDREEPNENSDEESNIESDEEFDNKSESSENEHVVDNKETKKKIKKVTFINNDNKVKTDKSNFLNIVIDKFINESIKNNDKLSKEKLMDEILGAVNILQIDMNDNELEKYINTKYADYNNYFPDLSAFLNTEPKKKKNKI